MEDDISPVAISLGFASFSRATREKVLRFFVVVVTAPVLFAVVTRAVLGLVGGTGRQAGRRAELGRIARLCV